MTEIQRMHRELLRLWRIVYKCFLPAVLEKDPCKLTKRSGTRTTENLGFQTYMYDANHLITSLDSSCHSPVQVGPKLTHNLHMLQPSKHLIEQMDHIAPFETRMVKIVNRLLKEAGSRKKRNIGEDDGPEDVEQDERPTKRAAQK